MNDHYQLYQLYQETKPYTSTIWQTIYQTANQIIEEQMAYIQAQYMVQVLNWCYIAY